MDLYIPYATTRTFFVPHQLFPNPPPFFISSVPPSCVPFLHFCQNHRGSCLFTLFFLGIKAVAITHCQLYGTPEPPPPPVPHLSPDAHDGCGEEGGVGTECVCVCVHMEMCLAELVTENEQRSRRCWFVLQQGPPHLIRPQSQHTVWHDTNTAYGNETCIWLQLGAMWPSLHKSPALRRATFEGGL